MIEAFEQHLEQMKFVEGAEKCTTTSERIAFCQDYLNSQGIKHKPWKLPNEVSSHYSYQSNPFEPNDEFRKYFPESIPQVVPFIRNYEWQYILYHSQIYDMSATDLKNYENYEDSLVHEALGKMVHEIYQDGNIHIEDRYDIKSDTTIKTVTIGVQECQRFTKS